MLNDMGYNQIRENLKGFGVVNEYQLQKQPLHHTMRLWYNCMILQNGCNSVW